MEVQKRCLQYMNFLNIAIALAFMTLMIIGYANTSDVKPWVFKLWTVDSIISAIYLFAWIGTLCFLFLKIRKMKKFFLPNKRTFLTHAFLIFFANLTGYISIIMFTLA